jgi:hypothetical protein
MNENSQSEAIDAIGKLLLMTSKSADATRLVAEALITTLCKAFPPLADDLLDHIDMLEGMDPNEEPLSDEEAEAMKVFHAAVQNYKQLIAVI